MGIASATRAKVEYGDFQTPITLAYALTTLIRRSAFLPASILEPSCGVGNILLAATDAFPYFQTAVGVEVQSEYLAELERRCLSREDHKRISVRSANFFDLDWPDVIAKLPEPILVIGNPPWVTNSTLATLQSDNLPEKSNFQRHKGLDAVTGKSNFDISEAMLIRLFRWLTGRNAMLVMLCKTAVARKILAHAWKTELPMSECSIRRIDSVAFFNAAVDACVFQCRFGKVAGDAACPVFEELDSKHASQVIGFHDGRMLANTVAYEQWRHLEGKEVYRWRSGIKHDCAELVELRRHGENFVARDGKIIDIEPDYLFPMLKASDLANGRPQMGKRWMLVTQRTVGEDTNRIAVRAPKTWAYLNEHVNRFTNRASAIYKNRPAFSMFGLGPYSFAPWKVGIAGLYKKLAFRVIGPWEEKPIVLDDTCYFVACRSKEEAAMVAEMLNHPIAQEFYSAFVFWDAKRPVTVDLLRRLDLGRLAKELGRSVEFGAFAANRNSPPDAADGGWLWND